MVKRLNRIIVDWGLHPPSNISVFTSRQKRNSWFLTGTVSRGLRVKPPRNRACTGWDLHAVPPFRSGPRRGLDFFPLLCLALPFSCAEAVPVEKTH